jgi:type VI secretion system secreted protein VgrG
MLASLVLGAPSAFAVQGPVGLGTAESFAILAGSGITNTGATTITGDVGTFPTPSETGFGSVTLTGTNHDGDAVTMGAKNDLVTAYNDAFGRTPVTNVPVELGGTTLLAGVYKSGTFGLTGTLVLDAQGNTNAQFIFQAASTVITASNSRVLLLNGADPCRVVWQLGSSATFGTGTQFVGDVLAYTSITATTGATFQGRLLALNGAVTLDHNTITNANCVAPVGSGGSPSPSATATATGTPSPAATLEATPTPSASSAASSSPSATPTPALASGPPAGSAGGPPATPHLPSTPPHLALTGLAILAILAAGLILLNAGGFVRLTGRRRRKAQAADQTAN